MQDFKVSQKEIFHIIGFLSVLIVILSIASHLLDPVRLGLENEVSERDRYFLGLLAEPEHTVDVVVLGDSESYTFMSPMHIWENTGIASYIAGQSGQRTTEAYYALRRIMKKQSPKLVIIETNMMFTSTGMLSDIKNAASETANYYFPVLKYHSLWKYIVEGSAKFPIHYNGFEARTAVAPYTGGAYMVETEEQEKISMTNQLYMRKIKELCEKNGTKLLWITAPSPKNHTMSKHNAMEAYAKELQVPYVDLNMKTEELGIDWATDTLDMGDHLNLSGALKTSAYMEQYLLDNYDLPDHRGETQYEVWNQRAEEFNKQLP